MVASPEQAAVPDIDGIGVVRQFGAVPPWLADALNAEKVMAALKGHVPEFASGELDLRDCAIDLLNLKSTEGQWGRTWTLTVAGPDGVEEMPMRVALVAPGLPVPELPGESLPFGAKGWRCWLPELRLLFRPNPAKKEKQLPALAQLTDPEQSRTILEAALREQAEGYADATITACQPTLVRNKPGRSAIIRYRIDYDPADRGWRNDIIAKAYDDDLGRNAFAGMQAVWQAGLKNNAALRLAEPLAYLAEQQVTVQGPVPEQRDLEKLINALILSDDPADLETLHTTFRAVGVALATLHRCGATAARAFDWAQAFEEPEEQIEWLRVPFPSQIAAIQPLIDWVRQLEAATPADAPVPSHGAFRPEQLLLHDGKIGLIDFDLFCMAEPASDIGLFRATMLDNGLYDNDLRPKDAAEIQKRLERIDALNESFLAAYEAHAPVSRQRVALWEAVFYINDSLQCWTKPRPNALRLVVPVLERHLRALGVL